MDKTELIHALSKKTNFLLTDCAEFVDSFIEVLHDVVKNEEPFRVKDLGIIRYSTIKPHEGVKPTHGVKGKSERIQIPETYRVTFRLSDNIRDAIYEEDDEV